MPSPTSDSAEKKCRSTPAPARQASTWNRAWSMIAASAVSSQEPAPASRCTCSRRITSQAASRQNSEERATTAIAEVSHERAAGRSGPAAIIRGSVPATPAAMFESLTQRLSGTIDRLRGSGRLTEENIREATREVRIALLDADVALPVVQALIQRIKVRAVGQ